jgi:hypothetical protein
MSQEHAIELGDIVDVLKDYESNVFDAVLCDPPYGLSFMGKRWDYDVPSVALWKEVHRVLKPGAPLIAFGGTRTYHRLVVNVEDAGFEIRDQLLWLFGSGFPKSMNVSMAIDDAAGAERPVIGERTLTGNAAYEEGGVQLIGSDTRGTNAKKVVPVTGPATELAKAWNGYGTALKPAVEPAVLARKPLDGTVAENVAKWGVGALAIDACRIGREEGDRTDYGRDSTLERTDDTAALGKFKESTPYTPDEGGRWPANVILDEVAGAMLDAQTGDRPSTLTGRADPKKKHANPADPNTERGSMFGNAKAKGTAVYADSGGASRFFYCPKANRKERDIGCEDLPTLSGGQATGRKDDSAGTKNPRAGAGRGGGAKNFHPTVKPIALCEYLARLIMPANPDAILVPFSGSGSEMIGALRAGWPVVVGIERENPYVEIARRRIAAAMKAA